MNRDLIEEQVLKALRLTVALLSNTSLQLRDIIINDNDTILVNVNLTNYNSSEMIQFEIFNSSYDVDVFQQTFYQLMKIFESSPLFTKFYGVSMYRTYRKSGNPWYIFFLNEDEFEKHDLPFSVCEKLTDEEASKLIRKYEVYFMGKLQTVAFS
jgi:hypothetical protein